MKSQKFLKHEIIVTIIFDTFTLPESNTTWKDFVTKKQAIIALSKAAAKLPIKTKFVDKGEILWLRIICKLTIIWAAKILYI